MATLATDIIGELKGRLVVAQSNIREIHTAIRKACALSYAEVGQSLADKVNEIAGTEYDSSLFEYFFSANPEDLK